MKSPSFVRVNFTLPIGIYVAFKCLVPERRRSKSVASLIGLEVKKLEQRLSKSAKAVEADKALHKDMEAWDNTLSDGLDDAPWK